MRVQPRDRSPHRIFSLKQTDELRLLTDKKRTRNWLKGATNNRTVRVHTSKEKIENKVKKVRMLLTKTARRTLHFLVYGTFWNQRKHELYNDVKEVDRHPKTPSFWLTFDYLKDKKKVEVYLIFYFVDSSNLKPTAIIVDKRRKPEKRKTTRSPQKYVAW